MKNKENDVPVELNEQTIHILEGIADGMPGGFFIYHADGNEELIFINKSMLRIFGCDTNEEFKRLTGNTFKGIVHPDDYEKVEKSIYDQISNSIYGLDYVEYRIIQKDGTVRWLEDYGHFVHTDVYGDIFYVFVDDATERLKRRMENLEKLNARLHEAYVKEKQYRKAILSDAMTFFEVNLTKDTFLTEASQVEDGKEIDLFEYMGVEPFDKYSDYVNFCAERLEPDDREKYRKFFDPDRLIRCYSKGDLEQICDFQITDTYDRKRFIQYIFLLGKNMHTQDVIGLFTAKDMTAQVERQHLLQSALKQAKGATVAREVFLSNMSHDIRTPLNAIIGYTELAEKNSGFKDKVDGYIEQIRMASEQLLSIVTESMEVTRMESGNFNLSNSDFNLNNLLDELKKSFEKQFAAKNIEFEMDKSGIENHDVIADFVRMKEMIGQLLDNAVKYTNSKGKIRLIVRENNINLKGYRKYEFVIEDTGIGMSKEFQEKMFEPFSRENNTTHSGVLGTGLGLALVNNIVDMMEGEIDVRSAPGKGTSFSIKVLLRLQKEQTAKESAEDKEIAQYSDVHNVHVLLAEDNDINREIITELLSENGYVVDSGENGAVVLEKLKSAPAGYYSIVLMDIQMPVMDGYEAARAIRKLDNKQLANIPIVALSANAFAEDFQRSREAGMDAHVTKPIDTHYLFEVMQQMM